MEQGGDGVRAGKVTGKRKFTCQQVVLFVFRLFLFLCRTVYFHRIYESVSRGKKQKTGNLSVMVCENIMFGLVWCFKIQLLAKRYCTELLENLVFYCTVFSLEKSAQPLVRIENYDIVHNLRVHNSHVSTCILFRSSDLFSL